MVQRRGNDSHVHYLHQQKEQSVVEIDKTAYKMDAWTGVLKDS